MPSGPKGLARERQRPLQPADPGQLALSAQPARVDDFALVRALDRGDVGLRDVG